MNSNPEHFALRVFIVDNAAPVRRRMAGLIGALDGVEIVGEAEESDAALAGIETGAADLVVTELHLSDETGLELLQLLERSMPQVIVMVLTNHSDAWTRRACLLAGAHYFFDKTSEFDLARSTLQRIASEYRTRALIQSGAHHV